MNVRLLLMAGAFLLFCTPLFAQKLTGTVTSAGKPLAGGSVQALPSGGGTSTDSVGNYSLVLKPGTYQVTFSDIGFEKKTVTVKLAAGEDKVLNVELASASESLKEVVVLGARGAGRSKIESAVPVDVISVNSVNQTTAKPDLMSQLNQNVPSFNYNKQSGGDGSDAIDFASLRGLGFDETLVLVNGKRRHLSAFVNEVGTRGRGNSGTDLNAIPESSIDHVEILRDGASAQYGSDAIAGVINIVLKKDINHLNFTAGFSGYDDPSHNTLNYSDPNAYYTGKKFDGQTLTLGGDYGITIGGNGGFLNIGGNYENQGKTFRDDPNLAVSRERRAFGDGSVESGGGMYNMEVPIKGTSTVFYSFGGYNYKHSNVYAYTRSWDYDGGLRQNPTKFPTDPVTGALIFVPGIMKVDAPAGAPYDPNNVFYDPEEDVYIKDESAAFGFKGTTPSEWDWDISNVTGRNDFHYFGNNTFNASIPYVAGQPIQTRFDDGGFNFLQNTANADITKHFKGVGQGLQLSFGGEFRYERYQLYAGEPNSYNYGGATLPDGTEKASGSEGYPGYQPYTSPANPGDAHTADRTSEAAYTELAFDVTNAWLVDVAERIENYSDFGFVATEKFATRYKLTSNFNLRGSISTGFRAPTLQQLNFSNTNTSIIGGNLVYTKLVPNYSDVAETAGIPKLTQETSVNYSLGFAWQPVHNLTVTVDGYDIIIKNRIVISGLYAAGDPTLGAPLNNILASQGIGDAQFFANAVNTTNKGIDIVIDYKKRWDKTHFNLLLAGNIQGLTIDKINIPETFRHSASDSATFFSDREQYFLKASAPKAKFTLNLEYGIQKFAFGTHLTYYGDVKELGFGETGVPANAPDQFFPYVTLDNSTTVVPEIFDFHPKITTDLYVSLKVGKALLWTAGVDNLFNVHPDVALVKGSVSPTSGSSSFGDSESGGPYEAVQMGFNGTRIFTKLTWNF